MKIAILLCGHVRTWNQCQENFNRTFNSSENEITIFSHTYDKKYGYHPYIASKLGITTNIDADEFSLDPTLFKLLEIEKEPTEIDVPDIDEYPINLDIYSQIRKFRLCNELRKKWCEANNTYHDLIIKTRFDVLYSDGFCLPESPNENTIYIPSCPITLYPSDVCYMGNSNSITTLIEKLSRKYPQKIINPHDWLNMCLEGINLVEMNINSSVTVKRYSQ